MGFHNSMLIGAVMCLCLLFFARAKLLEGSDKRCNEEGATIIIPGITDDASCIDCFCRSGNVKCQRHSCSNMDGCHAILHEKPQDSCCEVCKGCNHNGTQYPSGATWTDSSDQCQLFHCEAGVVTQSAEKCHVTCDEPIHLPGECCPSCSDCFVEGVDRLNGETFQLRSDPDVTCTCKGGHVTCSYRPCPVLNCPDDAMYKPKGARCPKCKGQRKIFNLPTSCFFAKRVFSQGTILKPDPCTSCTCWGGTVHCQRETCPPPPCDVTEQLYERGSCCPKCKKQRDCVYNNKTYQAGQYWTDKARCQQCRCNNGVVYCSRQTCAESVLCPKGQTLKLLSDSCCPRCVTDDAVCSFTSDSYHTTFDGHMFHAHGECRYHLSRDCSNNTFFVKIRNSPRTSEEFWTELVTVGIGNQVITLHRNLKARVNRKRVSLPYVIPSQFALQRLGNSVIVNAYRQLGVKVAWDGRNRLEVTVSKAHKNKLCGLCGNSNGDPKDDLKDKEGGPVTSGAQFLEAWRVRGVCHVPKGPVASDLITACKPGSPGAVRAEGYCGVFFDEEFRACSARVDILPYISSCLHDSCVCKRGESCHLRSIRSLSRRCKRAGFPVRWWRVAR